MEAVVILIVLGLVILAVGVLAAMLAPPEDLAAAGVVMGPWELESSCCAGTRGAEVAGPEQLAFGGPLLVCNVCDRVRTRPGHWVAGGSAPFGGVDAIRRAGKAEECVCKWCASMQRERLGQQVKQGQVMAPG